MMQGRRDFAFGIEQALSAYRALAGPKQLWIGLHGHAPSSGVAADTPAMLAEGARWFDRFLRGDTAAPLAEAGRDLARELDGAAGALRGACPKVVVRRPTAFGSAGRRIAQSGQYRSHAPDARARDRGLRLARSSR